MNQAYKSSIIYFGTINITSENITLYQQVNCRVHPIDMIGDNYLFFTNAV